MKTRLSALFFVLFLAACSNYFSDYRTVYRIETTSGERYYSDSEPKFDDKEAAYVIEDLDGNVYRFEKSRIHEIEKYKHKK